MTESACLLREFSLAGSVFLGIVLGWASVVIYYLVAKSRSHDN